jgi:hypothetical protein
MIYVVYLQDGRTIQDISKKEGGYTVFDKKEEF